MDCLQCQKEIKSVYFYRENEASKKFCSNECCDEFWEQNPELTCYICNKRIKEGDYYYNHNDDPQLKICVSCRQWGGKSQAEKDYEKNEKEITRLEREIKEIKQDPNRRNNVEWQNRLNFQQQELNRLKDYQKNNKPQRRKPGNTGSPIKFNVSGSSNSSQKIGGVPGTPSSSNPSPSNKYLPLILAISGGLIILLLLVIILLLVNRSPRRD